jgi:hypothetical protein
MLVRFPAMYLAFDMAQLHQVNPMPDVQYSQTMPLGIAPVVLGGVDDPSLHHVIVLDLYHKLYGVSLDSPSHLLLLSAHDGLIYGVPLATLPEIYPIASDLLAAPTNTDDAPLAVGFTRQVVRIPELLGEQSLFIVDGNSLAQEVRRLVASGTDNP